MRVVRAAAPGEWARKVATRAVLAEASTVVAEASAVAALQGAGAAVATVEGPVDTVTVQWEGTAGAKGVAARMGATTEVADSEAEAMGPGESRR